MTNSGWQCSNQLVEGWTLPGFVSPPDTFSSPNMLGSNGVRPWGVRLLFNSSKHFCCKLSQSQAWHLWRRWVDLATRDFHMGSLQDPTLVWKVWKHLTTTQSHLCWFDCISGLEFGLEQKDHLHELPSGVMIFLQSALAINLKYKLACQPGPNEENNLTTLGKNQEHPIVNRTIYKIVLSLFWVRRTVSAIGPSTWVASKPLYIII